ncbi:MAG: response regulator [Verrucomicrobiota bacterium]
MKKAKIANSMGANNGIDENHFEERTFLLIENHEHDVLLMKEAFLRAAIPNPLRVLSGGDKAIAYLKGVSPFRDRASHPLPSVLLLDLYLPGKDGFAVIDWVRHHPTLRRLMIIGLTNSSRGEDADRAYDLGINYYLTKPGPFTDLVNSMSRLYLWLRLCHFPRVV